MKMRFATPALLMVGVLAFAACGGDDDSGGSVLGRSSTTKEQSGSASASATTKATSDSSDDTATTSSGSTGSGVTVDTNFSGKGSKDFCNYLKDAKNEVEDLNLGENSSPSDLKKSFQTGRDAIAGAVSRAPSEIKADVQTLSDYFGKLDDILSKYDYDYTKLAAEAQKDPQVLQQFTAIESSSDIEAATTRLDAYTSQVCGIDTTGTTGG